MFGTCNENGGNEIPTFWSGICGVNAVWKVGRCRREECIKMNQREAEGEGRLD
jgi:hypothetical protein